MRPFHQESRNPKSFRVPVLGSWPDESANLDVTAIGSNIFNADKAWPRFRSGELEILGLAAASWSLANALDSFPCEKKHSCRCECLPHEGSGGWLIYLHVCIQLNGCFMFLVNFTTFKKPIQSMGSVDKFLLTTDCLPSKKSRNSRREQKFGGARLVGFFVLYLGFV